MPQDKFEKAKYDKLQTVLDVKGISPNTFKFARIELRDKTQGKLIMCPFCLKPSYLTQFKYDKGFYCCPHCENRLAEKTLSYMFDIFNREKIEIEKYAKWVFDYRLNGFFQKINFKQWLDQLKNLEISYEFWDNYKRFKGENKSSKVLQELGY